MIKIVAILYCLACLVALFIFVKYTANAILKYGAKFSIHNCIYIFLLKRRNIIYRQLRQNTFRLKTFFFIRQLLGLYTVTSCVFLI